LSNPVKGFQAKVIDHINGSHAPVISIDIPSGLFSDESMRMHKDASVVRATHTLTFAPVKLGFLFPENDPYVGTWHLLDIGISQEFIDHTETKNYFLMEEEIRPILRSRNSYSHKGHFGHALLICGSKGKMGAAVLAARACLRSGAGLVSLHIPASANAILQTAVPEAMVYLDESDNYFTAPGDIAMFNVIAVGPGIGQEKDTANALKLLIQNSTVPLILDADAINLLGENKTWIPFLPKGSILTPHPKEFERLAGKTSDHFERNRVQREFSMKHGVYIILKGAHTVISSPDGSCYFNSTGNPGMATGGSGDVLTGILAGLKAQGYSSLETCLIGTYIHGLAGDFAESEKGQEALIAGDIVENLGKAFLSLHNAVPEAGE
jgi:ADP-dependent NAD(P)H-hydrate dehydratase / NAD(P)H-hydrate epimerase